MSRPHSNTNAAALEQHRDSLELASLASSSHSSGRLSEESSASGVPSSRKLSFDNEDPLRQQGPAGHSRMSSRTFSISSAFDFAPPLFPSTAANGYTSLGAPAGFDSTVAAERGSLEQNKSLTYFNGMALVIGGVIGSGIFSSPYEVNANAGSPGAALIVWTVAGLLVWTGASSYAELGGALPLNGGAQVYLSKIFGELLGFLFSWCSVLVIKPGSAAVVSIIFGEYAVRAVVGAEVTEVSSFINKGVAIAGLAVVVLLNAVSTKLAVRTASIFLFLKFIALLVITIGGIFVAITGSSWDGEENPDWDISNWFQGSKMDFTGLAVALYAGLWAYEGWDATSYVTGELRNPSRDVPRVIHTATPLVITLYLLANVAYFIALPPSITSTSSTIAVAFGNQLAGRAGAIVMAVAVSGSCFGTINAGTFTTSRLYYAAAREGYLPKVFGTLGFRGRRNHRLPAQNSSSKQRGWPSRIFSSICADSTSRSLFFTPVASLALFFVLAATYIVIGTFSSLIFFNGVAVYIFYFLTVLGLLVLRVKEPDLERPYRCWITTPIIFCCVSLFLLSRSVVARPLLSLAVVAFILAGVGVYYGIVKRNSASGRQAGGVGEKPWKFWRRWRGT